MEHSEFEIGKTFFASAGFEWLCTDKGTRVITAIMLDPDKDSSWFNGPPYAVEEVVFDEYDLPACYTDENEMLLDMMEDKSVHPGFSSEDVKKMSKERRNDCRLGYPQDKVLTRDRISTDGKIFHPYSKEQKDGKWYVKIIEIFSHEYSMIDINDFVLLDYSNEEAMKKRNNQVNGEK